VGEGGTPHIEQNMFYPLSRKEKELRDHYPLWLFFPKHSSYIEDSMIFLLSRTYTVTAVARRYQRLFRLIVLLDYLDSSIHQGFIFYSVKIFS